MALLWIEGFEGFGTSTGVAPSPTGIISRKYPNVLNEDYFDVETGRGSGYCLEANYLVTNSSHLQSPNLTTNSTVVLGVAIKIVSATTIVSKEHIGLYDGSTRGINLHIETDLTISVYRDSTLLGSTTNSLSVGSWYYIELKVFTNNTTGTVDLKVNGSTWKSLTNQDTQPGANAYHTAFRLSALAYSAMVAQYDDLYFLDTSGSANNDFLGNRKVVALDASGVGAVTNWTPSAGSNYQNIDDGSLLDEDTTYNETSSDADLDLYAYGDLAGDISSVDGVQINSEARVTAGQMDLSNAIRTGTTTYPGTPETITSTSYVTITRIEEQDPDTSAAWTPSGVNGAQFGIKANT